VLQRIGGAKVLKILEKAIFKQAFGQNKSPIILTFKIIATMCTFAIMLPTREEILKFAIFKTSRSGGKGGQHVNKVSSKVELVFDLNQAIFFSDEEKQLLNLRLENRLDSDGLLHIVAQEDRSQLLNKEKAIIKLIDLLKRSLLVQKKRKPTKIPRAVIEKRLQNKSLISSRKESRKRPSID